MLGSVILTGRGRRGEEKTGCGPIRRLKSLRGENVSYVRIGSSQDKRRVETGGESDGERKESTIKKAQTTLHHLNPFSF